MERFREPTAKRETEKDQKGNNRVEKHTGTLSKNEPRRKEHILEKCHK